MIRFIAAIDKNRGIADDHGIPWQGRIPSDVAYYEQKIRDGIKLMGYGLYRELKHPMPEGINYVATRSVTEPLRPGFEAVLDARAFLRAATEDVWNLGGAILFSSTLDLADELYLTELDAEFACTKFFPEFRDAFELVSSGDPITESGITFRFNVYKRKSI